MEDRIGRLLGNVFATPLPKEASVAVSANGNGKRGPTEAKAIPVIDPRIFGSQFVPLNSSGDILRLESFENLAWYGAAWLPYACMRYRATKLIEAPLWIAEENAEGEEEWIQGDHPLAELLERPNPDMEMADLLELTSLYLDSTGSCIWVKNRDRGQRIGSLYPFSGEDFKVESADGLLYGRYRLRAKGGERVLGPEDVVHFRNASPADPHKAVSPLDAALARLGVDRTLVESIRHGLQNAVVPGLSIEFLPEAQLTPDQLEQFKALLGVNYAEARNHGKSLVTGGARTRQNRLGFEGLNGGELAKEIEAAVCACFQLPPVVIGAYVGLANSSDRHNLETSVVLVYDNAILPTWSRMEKALTRALLRDVDTNPLRFIRFDKTKIKALQEDMGHKADIVQKAEKALRIDDARVLLGLEPLGDERGERLMSETVAAPAVEEQEDQAEPKTGAGPREVKQEDDLGTRWLMFDAAARSHELGWQLAAMAQLEEDQSAALRIIQSGGKASPAPSEQKDDPPPFGPADADAVRRIVREISDHMDLNAAVGWRERMTPLVESTGRAALSSVVVEMGVSFDLLQPGLEAYTQREAAWLVKQVTDTTKQEIRDALASGLVEGESIPDLAERIRQSGTFARTRAELIARTETTRVFNGAQRDSLSAYQAATGDTIKKRWLATRDNRTRDAHLALHGETRGVDEEFSNGLQAPGEPNCRCTLTYELEAAA